MCKIGTEKPLVLKLLPDIKRNNRLILKLYKKRKGAVMDIYRNDAEIPLGFGIALAKNDRAMAYYSSLTPQHQREIIARTHCIQSKKEMESFIDGLANGGMVT